MATSYNPYSSALPAQQAHDDQRKVSQQVNRPRGRRAHPERLKAILENRKIPRVRVEPVSEEIRRCIAHPNGMAFRAQGSVEWPMDRFTRRRIAEGSVRIVEMAEGRQEREKEKQRQQQKPAPRNGE